MSLIMILIVPYFLKDLLKLSCSIKKDENLIRTARKGLYFSGCYLFISEVNNDNIADASGWVRS